MGLLRLLAVAGLLVWAAAPTASRALADSQDGAPRVFMGRAEFEQLRADVARQEPSFTRSMFDSLEDEVRRVLDDGPAAQPYSGCSLDAYLQRFSYQLPPYARRGGPPGGDAVTAARLALYAALAPAGAGPSGLPAKAAAGARTILLAWARSGFRGTDGQYLAAPDDFCGAGGTATPDVIAAVGLQVGRGIAYSVFAQDLLQAAGALSGEDSQVLDDFHAAMGRVVRRAMERRWELVPVACDRFGNHLVNQLLALMAVARLTGDRAGFERLVSGAGSPFDLDDVLRTTIRGDGDAPLPCYSNATRDKDGKQPFFSTPDVSPGEVADRFRHLTPLQGFGYPMFTVSRLLLALRLMEVAGEDPFRTWMGDRLLTSVRYYACYAEAFGATVVPDRPERCPNQRQYAGMRVHDHEAVLLSGARHWPGFSPAHTLQDAMRSALLAPGQSVDPLFFGDWPR